MRLARVTDMSHSGERSAPKVIAPHRRSLRRFGFVAPRTAQQARRGVARLRARAAGCRGARSTPTHRGAGRAARCRTATAWRPGRSTRWARIGTATDLRLDRPDAATGDAQRSRNLDDRPSGRQRRGARLPADAQALRRRPRLRPEPGGTGRGRPALRRRWTARRAAPGCASPSAAPARCGRRKLAYAPPKDGPIGASAKARERTTAADPKPTRGSAPPTTRLDDPLFATTVGFVAPREHARTF